MSKGKKISEEARTKLSEAAKKRNSYENLKSGTHAAKLSPKSGRFDTNINAKDWVLISPTGIRYECRSLSNFVRKNPEIFGIDGSDEKVNKFTNGLRVIKYNIMHDRRGQTFHGWTIEIR